MLEEPQFKVFKTIIKKAGYMSALWECLRQIIAGSKEPKFKEVLLRDLAYPFVDGVFYTAISAQFAEGKF